MTCLWSARQCVDFNTAVVDMWQTSVGFFFFEGRVGEKMVLEIELNCGLSCLCVCQKAVPHQCCLVEKLKLVYYLNVSLIF